MGRRRPSRPGLGFRFVNLDDSQMSSRGTRPAGQRKTKHNAERGGDRAVTAPRQPRLLPNTPVPLRVPVRWTSPSRGRILIVNFNSSRLVNVYEPQTVTVSSFRTALSQGFFSLSFLREQTLRGAGGVKKVIRVL